MFSFCQKYQQRSERNELDPSLMKCLLVWLTMVYKYHTREMLQIFQIIFQIVFTMITSIKKIWQHEKVTLASRLEIIKIFLMKYFIYLSDLPSNSRSSHIDHIYKRLNCLQFVKTHLLTVAKLTIQQYNFLPKPK